MGLLTQSEIQYYDSSNLSNYGDYQFVSLKHIISGFMVSYVGEGKIISKVNKADVQFHAMRGLQEFSYDVFKCIKSQEIEVPNTLKMILPQDYVNYSKITRVDNDGVERILYPTGKTSNPLAINQNDSGEYTFSGKKFKITCKSGDQFADGDFISLPYLSSDPGLETDTVNVVFDKDGDVIDGTAPSSSSFAARYFVGYNNSMTSEQIAVRLANKIREINRYNVDQVGSDVFVTFIETYPAHFQITASGGVNFQLLNDQLVVTDVSETGLVQKLSLKSESEAWSRYKSGNTNSTTTEDYDREDHTMDVLGRRYGLDPQHAQGNGTFYIDTKTGFIHFGSSLSGQTIVLHYVSDGLGTDEEMVVHKFAEEAIYKWIAYGIVASRSNMPEYIVQRFKRERFAEARKAKIRLSNIKIEEFAQIIKGLGKPIK